MILKSMAISTGTQARQNTTKRIIRGMENNLNMKYYQIIHKASIDISWKINENGVSEIPIE